MWWIIHYFSYPLAVHPGKTVAHHQNLIPVQPGKEEGKIYVATNIPHMHALNFQFSIHCQLSIHLIDSQMATSH